MRARLAALLALVLAIASLCLSERQAHADVPTPGLSEERVILHTIAGDLVLALYPAVAPQTVEQILKLVRAGVYDGTAFVRIEPGFVAQLSAANDRTTPLDPQQQALVHKIPGEFSKLPHVRGVLSMAREDADVNSNETSFSILLGPAPHLDGKYTIFGRLESGEAVIDEMLRVPRGAMLRPVVRLDVIKAEVVPASELASMSLVPARPVVVPEGVTNAVENAVAIASTTVGGAGGRDVGAVVAWSIAFMCLIGLVSFFLQGRVPVPVHGSLNLLNVLIGAFVLIVVALPHGQQRPWLATLLFFGLIGMFKVLGRFESPSQK